MPTGRPLAAKLFLECKEVPFIGASVTSTVGQAAIAYIDLVPHKAINNIKPRTLVQIMVRDFSDKEAGYPWILMFEGEVFGINFSKTPDSRNFSISCIDKTGYWDNVLMYFFNTQQAGGISTTSISQIAQETVQAGKDTSAIAVSVSKAAYFKTIIDEKLQEEGTDFLDGVVEVFKKFEKINEFYKLAEERLRITDRVVLKSSGKLQELLTDSESLTWFSNIMGQESGFNTLRKTLGELLGLIFHDQVTVPFPAKVEVKTLRGASIKASDDKKRTIGEFIFKPNLFMLPPPACNIFYPDEYASYTFSRNFFQEPTRLQYMPELPVAFQPAGIALAMVFLPQSFSAYMHKGSGENPDIGKGPLQTRESFGNYNDEDPNSETSEASLGSKKAAQFLTNEERMRGILLAQESVVPVSSAFRTSLENAGKASMSQRIAKYLFYKKRFQPRTIQITSHLKMSVVPGFPVLILDDSDADQNVIAYCNSVTHRIYATQGGYTNVTLSYARTVGEQDTISENQEEPPLPPWFDEAVFGSYALSSVGVTVNWSEQLSIFYAALLGNQGSRAITDLKGTGSVLTATKRLISEYRSIKSKGAEAVQNLISDTTARDYVDMSETFRFLKAGTNTKDLNAAFLEFFGMRVSGGSSPGPVDVGYQPPTNDRFEIQARRKVIDDYRTALKGSRGFRG